MHLARRACAHLFGLLLFVAVPLPAWSVPVKTAGWTVDGVAVEVVSIDLTDPQTVLAVQLAGQADMLHPPVPARGAMPFARFLATAKCAAAINGTFFSLALGTPTMGTLVTSGVLANHVAWRPKGTAFGLTAGNRPNFAPAADAAWRRQWLSLAAGPRLLVAGRTVLRPVAEGITDPDVLGAATRTAIRAISTARARARSAARSASAWRPGA